MRTSFFCVPCKDLCVHPQCQCTNGMLRPLAMAVERGGRKSSSSGAIGNGAGMQRLLRDKYVLAILNGYYKGERGQPWGTKRGQY